MWYYVRTKTNQSMGMIKTFGAALFFTQQCYSRDCALIQPVNTRPMRKHRGSMNKFGSPNSVVKETHGMYSPLKGTQNPEGKLCILISHRKDAAHDELPCTLQNPI